MQAIHTSPATNTIQALSLYQTLTARVLRASAVTWLAGYQGKLGRDGWKSELLNDWKAVDIIPPANTDTNTFAVQKAYLELARQHGIDPLTEAAINSAGKTRVLSFHDIEELQSWLQHPIKRQFLDTRNVGERMLGVYNLHPQAESYLLVDRCPTSPPFNEQDCANLQALLQLFPRLHYWLLLERGLIPPLKPLAPRYQEILQRLLHNENEQEIAEQLQLSKSTVHTYIIDLYKKFNVNSRSELMTLWLADPTNR